jgi:hypothetical protein
MGALSEVIPSPPGPTSVQPVYNTVRICTVDRIHNIDGNINTSGNISNHGLVCLSFGSLRPYRTRCGSSRAGGLSILEAQSARLLCSRHSDWFVTHTQLNEKTCSNTFDSHVFHLVHLVSWFLIRMRSTNLCQLGNDRATHSASLTSSMLPQPAR